MLAKVNREGRVIKVKGKKGNLATRDIGNVLVGQRGMISCGIFCHQGKY
jgi:hypothetical protein